MNINQKIALAPNVWHSVRPIADARSHCPPAVYQNKIYVFGGGGPQFASKSTVYMYDPASDTWKRRTNMPTHRSSSVTAVMGDQNYVRGGGGGRPGGRGGGGADGGGEDPGQDRG